MTSVVTLNAYSTINQDSLTSEFFEFDNQAPLSTPSQMGERDVVEATRGTAEEGIWATNRGRFESVSSPESE